MSAKQKGKSELEKLIHFRKRLDSAREKLSAFTDAELKETAAKDMRLDFVRVWKPIPFAVGKRPDIYLTNLYLNRGLEACKNHLQKQLDYTEKNIEVLKRKGG